MIDYKHTTDGDLDVSSGDIVLTESTWQHQRDLLLSDKGHIRDYPEGGVGAVNYLSDDDPESFLRETRKAFAQDGMKVKRLAISTVDGEMDVDASYEGNS